MHIALMAVSAASAPSGVCRHAANLARDLQSVKGVDQVTLITGAWQVSYFQQSLALAGDRLRIVPIHISNTSLSRNAWYLFRLPALIKSLRADILHLTFPVPFLRQAMPAPVVLTLHDLYPLDVPCNFGARVGLNRVALQVALRNADVTVCVSDPTRLRLQQAYPGLRHPAITIPHPIARLAAADNAPLPAELEGIPFLLCVAQHRANKNLLALLRGYHAALQANVLPADSRLVIVGNRGPETKALLAEIVSLGLDNQVLLLHGLSDSALATLYRRCELFVAVSIAEGFGLPVAEAMAHGSRVLCSDIPTFRQMVSSNCTLVPADAAPTRLSDAIASALAAPRSIHRVSLLTPVQAANRYLTVYQGLHRSKELHSASLSTSEPLHTGDA